MTTTNTKGNNNMTATTTTADLAAGLDPTLMQSVRFFAAVDMKGKWHAKRIVTDEADCGVPVLLDSTDSTIVRLVVDDPSKARELMVNNDFPYTECAILVAEIGDESELKGVLAALLEAEINIHYIYSFIKRPEGRSALAISCEDADTASQALGNRGFKILTQRDISR